MTIRVAALYRYPVKGLSPERLGRVVLRRGAYVPGDRVFAVENGPSGFDPEAPQHQPKIKFLMLMRNEALARLRTSYDEETGTLTVRDEGAAVSGDLGSQEGRAAIEAFLARAVPGELRGALRVLRAPDGFRFTDSRSGYVSLINLASVREIEAMVGASVDPLRFRGNIQVEGLEPWAEFDLIGTELTAPSGLRLKVTKPIKRCAATNVDPTTAARDLAIPDALMRRFGHMDCGVYAEVVAGGELEEGEELAPAAPRLPFAPQASCPAGPDRS